MKLRMSLLSFFALAVAGTYATSPHVASTPAPVTVLAVERSAHLPVADRDFIRPVLRGLVTVSPTPAVSSVPVVADPPSPRHPTVVVAPVSTPSPALKASTPARPLPKPTGSILAWEAKIGWCESRDNYTDLNRASGASGRYQFLNTTWNSNVKHFFASMYLGRAMDYPPAVQDAVFVKVFETQGNRPWAASRRCWENR